MAVEPRRAEFQDPFADFSLPSLLPRTLAAALHADPPPSGAPEMESIKALLGSIVLNKDVLEQAQTINKCCQNGVNSSQDGDKTVPADGKDRPLGRRPALGRKRAQFSLKPISSNPVPNVDFNSQIDDLSDPEEFFSAAEQHENADRELKKLRGEVPTELTKNQLMTGRKRRPGILGKTASYKHQFSGPIVARDAFSASQDLDGGTGILSKASTTTKSNENSCPNCSDQPDNPDSMVTNNKQSVTMEQEGFGAEEQKNTNNILGELLSSFKDLDEAEGTALLRKSLQIKSIEVEKFCLPELHTNQRNDFRTLDDGVTRKKSEVHQLPQTSRTLSRSPLAVLSKLQRHIPLNDPVENPYTILPSDDAPYAGDSRPNSCWQKELLLPPADVSSPDQNGLLARNASVSALSDDGRLSLVSELQTPATRAGKTIDDKIATNEEVTENSSFSPKCSAGGCRYHRMTDDQSKSVGFNKQMEEEGNHIQFDPLCEPQDPEVEDLASGCTDHNGRNGLVNTLVGTTEEHTVFGSNSDADKCAVDDILQNQVNVSKPDVLVVGAEATRENSIPLTRVLPMNEQSKDACVLAGENVETQDYATSGISQNNEKKQKASRSSKNKQKLVSRQSLAGAGMKWESGVRRSTRIRYKPLQYWRGERFLYGRIHNSLATVIGVKVSSGKDGELKVKSFVSEQYADLVAQAALH